LPITAIELSTEGYGVGEVSFEVEETEQARTSSGYARMLKNDCFQNELKDS